MRVLSICTTPEAARDAISAATGRDEHHVLVLVQEAIVLPHLGLDEKRIEVFASTEDLTARGLASAWRSVDSREVVRMISGAGQVRIL